MTQLPPSVPWLQNQGMQLSPFGVSATPPVGVGLHHQWTEEGVMVSPVVNGAQVLHLSVALCVLNDTYREAERLGVKLEGVAVEADGSLDAAWRSTGIEYCVTIDSIARADALDLLRAWVDEIGVRRCTLRTDLEHGAAGVGAVRPVRHPDRPAGVLAGVEGQAERQVGEFTL
jgi:hypothetical protein